MVAAFELAKVPSSASLRDVLLAIDHGGLGAALLVEADGRLSGLLTDGDARRALLAGRSLDSPARALLRPDYIHVQQTTARPEVLDLMRARRIDLVPIVDEAGTLVGCHHLHDVLGVTERPNLAVIMAGGRGTRLGALTANTPKPMLRVAGRPIIERLVLHLAAFGIRDIRISINYLGHIIEDHFGDGSAFGCRIRYLREESELGTAGSLTLLEPRDAPLLVVNGDLVTQADVGRMLDQHRASSAKLTVAVRRYFHTVPFGSVTLEGPLIVDIEEKPTLSRFINAGLYVLDPTLVTRLARNQRVDMPTVVSESLRQGDEVQAFEIVDDWLDVGQHEQLNQARGILSAT